MNPTVTPRRRTFRTAVQVTVAVFAAVPAAVGVLGLPASTSAAVVGIAGALVILVSAAQNAFDESVGNA